MKKSTKTLIKFLFIIAFGTAVFVCGWMNIFVPADGFAVMISKTSGVDPEVISRDSFCWKWQHLIPTNVKTVIFPEKQYTFREEVKGELPSAKLYASHLETLADFSYSASAEIRMGITKEKVLSLYREGAVTDSASLEKYLKDKALLATQTVSPVFFAGEEAEKLFRETVLEGEKLPDVLKAKDFEGITFSGITFTKAIIPDLELYKKARLSYDAYIEKLTGELKTKASKRADEILEDDRIINRLERFAVITQKYPEFSGIVKSQDFTQIIDALR